MTAKRQRLMKREELKARGREFMWLSNTRKRFGGELPEPGLLKMMLVARDFGRAVRVKQPPAGRW